MHSVVDHASKGLEARLTNKLLQSPKKTGKKYAENRLIEKF
jgi:hypothetical protein